MKRERRERREPLTDFIVDSSAAWRLGSGRLRELIRQGRLRPAFVVEDGTRFFRLVDVDQFDEGPEPDDAA